jgi:hypothetical protein
VIAWAIRILLSKAALKLCHALHRERRSVMVGLTQPSMDTLSRLLTKNPEICPVSYPKIKPPMET